MKKFLTSLAVAVLSLPCLAASFSNYEAYPAEGEVTAIDEVIITFPDFSEVVINSRDDLSVTRDGEPCTGWRAFATYKENTVKFVFTPAATEAGTYEFTMKGSSLCGYYGNNREMDLPEDLTFTYTIPAGAITGTFIYEADPVAGPVDELSTVTLTFPGFNEIEINSKDDIKALYKGQEISTCKVSNPYGSNRLVFTFTPAFTEAGNVELYIPAGSILGYDEDYNDTDLGNEIHVLYEVGNTAGTGNFDYEADPAEGNVTSLTVVNVTFPNFEEIDINSKDDIKVLYNGEPVSCDIKVAPIFSNNLCFIFEPSFTQLGELELYIPAGSICGYDEEYNETDLGKDISLKYNIVTPAAPVVYDLTITKGTPQFKTSSADGVITPDINMDLFALRSPVAGLNAADGATVTFASEDGTYSESAVLRFNMQSDGGAFGTFTQFKVVFNEIPSVNGTYHITIPQGSFGDAAWLADHQTGHSNPEIILEYILEGFADVQGPAYNLVPTEVTPTPDTTVKELTTIVLTFGERVYDTQTGTIVLSNIENRYSVTPSVSVRGSVVTLTIPENEAPTAYGTYSLSIERGRFCDNTYAETMEEGSLNGALFYSWTVNQNVGVGTIGAEDAEAPVYNIMGVKVAESLKELPAGIYVQGGRKVIVK